MGEEGEDLTPDRPVVQFRRAVDKKETDLQDNSLVTGPSIIFIVLCGKSLDGVLSILLLITWPEST